MELGECCGEEIRGGDGMESGLMGDMTVRLSVRL